ncbi:MAG: hypothetical protein LBU34_17285 [Planctomycetaceae bacterium]|nr:hypothetical protein [Planctomycetaceae bacterium]
MSTKGSNRSPKIHKVGGVSPKRRNVGAKHFSPLPHVDLIRCGNLISVGNSYQ